MLHRTFLPSTKMKSESTKLPYYGLQEYAQRLLKKINKLKKHKRIFKNIYELNED